MNLKDLFPKNNFRRLIYKQKMKVKQYFEWNSEYGIKYLLPNKLYIDHFDFVVTTKCNLRCKECCSLIPQYKNPYHANLEVLIQTLKKIDECVDRIGEFSILGGEPFLYPNLVEVISAIPRDKIRNAHITTNGTIVPHDKKLLDIIREKNIEIWFSDYNCSSKTQKEFIELCEKENISYHVKKGMVWHTFGDGSTNFNRSEKELKKQFLLCFSICKSIINGCVYQCPIHSHGCNLGKFERKAGEYVDLLHNTKKQNRKQLKKLMWRKTYVEACKYCKKGTDDFIFVNKGTQQ